MIWIVSDTAQEIQEDRENGIAIIKLPVNINGEPAPADLSNTRFFELLDDPNTEIRTSQASPAEFSELFEELTKNGDDVIAILVSSTLSGTYNSARLASMDFDKVHLIDSRQACMSQTALVKRAIELREQGLNASELCEELEKEKGQAHLFAMLPTLKYLKKGGRISPAKAAIADFAGIKPIVTISESGEVEPCAKSRGIRKALRGCIDQAINHDIDPERPIIIGVSGTDKTNLDILKQDLDEALGKDVDVQFVELSQLLSVHTGPGGAGIGFFSKDR